MILEKQAEIVELTETTRRPRLVVLDFLRGIAATLVAALHVSDHGPMHVPGTVGMSVLFFFILSGFVITYAYGDDLKAGRMGVVDFVVLRIARLYPLHAVTLFTVAVLIAVAHFASLEIGTRCGAKEFFEAAGLVHFLFGGSHCFNVPSWSITTEFWCGGVILALSAPAAASFRPYVFVVAIALFVWGETYGFMMSGPPQHLFGPVCFVIGWWICRLRPMPKGWVPLGLLAYVVSVAWMFIGIENDFIYVALFTTTIAFLANVTIVRPLVVRIMSTIGDWSYGIYMWHWPLLLALGGLDRLCLKISGVSTKDTLAFQIIFFAALFPIVAISYRYIELPAKRLIRQMTQAGRQARPVRTA